jgi:uncharacterized protein with NRDE domain
MCVVAIAINAHPRWRLVVAGNRDEYHARASAPLARWDDGSGIIAGRDLVSGGSWMGVSDSGRFAVVTNIRDSDGPDPAKLSRGALVADWLAEGRVPENPAHFNPFNLVVTNGTSAAYLSNRPGPLHQPLVKGIHGLSNAIPNEYWPRKDRLVQQTAVWLERSDDPGPLLDILSEETIPDREAHPVFIRSPIYGTRCSTVLTVDYDGQGQIIERRFGPNGDEGGCTSLKFLWSSQKV